MESQDSPVAAEETPSAYRPLRVWPAIILLVVLAVSRSITTMVEDLQDRILMGAFFG